jgi:hypothetical protein
MSAPIAAAGLALHNMLKGWLVADEGLAPKGRLSSNDNLCGKGASLCPKVS